MPSFRSHLTHALLISSLVLPAIAQADANHENAKSNAAAEAAYVEAMQKNATEADKKAFCSEMKSVAKELAGQLPIQIDPATHLISSSAVYLGGKCTYMLGYSLDEAKLFALLQEAISKQKGEEVPMAFVEQYYSTGEPGYQNLKEQMRQNLQNSPHFQRALELPFMEFDAQYVVNGTHMDDINFVISGK